MQFHLHRILQQLLRVRCLLLSCAVSNWPLEKKARKEEELGEVTRQLQLLEHVVASLEHKSVKSSIKHAMKGARVYTVHTI
jgi:hypothetical protein